MNFSLPENAESLLQKLIQIPSVNPAMAPEDPEISGELRCAQYVEMFLKSIGANVEYQWISDKRPNVLGSFPHHESNKPILLFAPHLDTVGVSGMTIPPFSGEIRNGAIWGRGASDTKGSVTSMLWALKECADLIPQLPYRIQFVGLANEECSQGGAKEFVKKYKADFVIVGEPSSLEAVHAHKGICHIHLITHGKAAHASQPHQGTNAINLMALVLYRIQKHWIPQLANIQCPALGQPTLSVGNIKGGGAVNVIPDLCEANIDMRLVPQLEIRTWLKEMQTDLQSIDPTLDLIVKRLSPAMSTDPEHPLMDLLIKNGAPLASTACYSDAGVFAAAGIPAVTIGPGSVMQAHTDDEHLMVSDLQDGVNFFVRFLKSLK